MLTCFFNAELEKVIMEGSEMSFQPAVLIDVCRVRGIIESIKNVVLEWALKLEAAGILGGDMTFSDAEKKRAGSISVSYYAENQTVVHSMNQSQLQQGSHQSSQIASFGLDVESVRIAISGFEAALGREKIAPEVREEIAAEVATIKAQLMKSTPSKSIIAEAGKSLRGISEGALGGALTPAAIAAASMLWHALGLG